MRVRVEPSSGFLSGCVEALLRQCGYAYAAPEQTADAVLTLGESMRVTTADGRQADIALPLRYPVLLEMLARFQPATRPLGAGWVFDTRSRACTHPGLPDLRLTDTESQLLGALLSASALSREQLEQQVLGLAEGVESHRLETHLSRLRAKLSSIPGLAIAAEDGAYRLLTAPQGIA